MGWTATKGHREVVFWMMLCDTSQGSSSRLSEYTRIPLQPACSLQRATSATRWMQVSGSPSLDCTQAENTSRLTAVRRSTPLLMLAPLCLTAVGSRPNSPAVMCMGGATRLLGGAAGREPASEHA